MGYLERARMVMTEHSNKDAYNEINEIHELSPKVRQDLAETMKSPLVREAVALGFKVVSVRDDEDLRQGLLGQTDVPKLDTDSVARPSKKSTEIGQNERKR